MTSPARGLFTTDRVVTVEGTVSDDSAVVMFLINGAPATLSGATFQTQLQLDDGLNVVTVEAQDQHGNKTVVAHSVVRADAFSDAATPIGNALSLRLNDGAFDAIERIVANKLTGPQLEALVMARNPLFQKDYKVFGLTAASVNLEATGVTIGNPTMSLRPVVGALEISGTLPNVNIAARAHGKAIGLIPYSIRGNISATSANFTGHAVVTVVNGRPVLDLDQVAITLDGFDFDINGIPGVLENLTRNWVRGFIEDKVEEMLDVNLPPALNQAIGGLTSQPIQQQLFGMQLAAGVAPRAIQFDALGATVVIDANVAFAALPGTPGYNTTPPATPGSVITFGSIPAPSLARHFDLCVNDDMVNRAAHSAWQAGVLAYEIDTANVPVQLPSFISLDSNLLLLTFPQLAGQIQPGDPILVRVSTNAPPVFRTTPNAAAPFELVVAELQLDILSKPISGAPKLVFSCNVSARVDASVSISNQNTLDLIVGQNPLIVADVHSEPLGDLDDIAVETLINFAVPPLLQFSGTRIARGIQLPMVQGLTFQNLSLGLAGPQRDFVFLSGDVQ